MPLDPLNLTREASINRVAIIDLPGIAVPDDVRGQRAYDLLSAVAVCDVIKPYRESLGISDDIPDTDLPRALDECFRSTELEIRRTADQIGAIIGKRLGCLILTLKRGDPINRQARTEWDESYWAHWATIQRVAIGGGLNRRMLGLRIAHHAQHFVHRHDFPDMQIERAVDATELSLIGAARSAPIGTNAAVIFDFGQTQIKRAFAEYQNDELAPLQMMKPIPSGCDTQDLYASGDEVQAKYRADLMVRIIADTIQAHQMDGSPLVIMCSMASYVQNGQPADRGCYGVLRSISDNVEQYFAERLSKTLARPVIFRLMHDGTAAAAAYAGTKNAAVITMGTALGIGFPPPAEQVRPFAPTFTIH